MIVLKKLISVIIILSIFLSFISPVLAWENKDSYEKIRSNNITVEDYCKRILQIIAIKETASLFKKSEIINDEFSWYFTKRNDIYPLNSYNDINNWLYKKQFPSKYPMLILKYNSKNINAFCLGGIVFITDGMFQLYKNKQITEGNMCGLLNHEHFHGVSDDGFEKSRWGTIGLITLAIIFGITDKVIDNRYYKAIADLGISLLIIKSLSGYSQDQEKLADSIATKETMAMGYPADSLSILLQKISGDKVVTGTEQFDNRCYFKSHPDLDERIENIKEAAANFDNSIYDFFPKNQQPTTYTNNPATSNTNITSSQNGITIIKIDATYNPNNSSVSAPTPNTTFNIITLTPPTSEKQNNTINSQISPVNSPGYNVIQLTPPDSKK